MYDLGTHLVYQAVQLFGPVSRVYAEVDHRLSSTSSDDDAFLALLHENGVRSHLWMSSVDLAPPRLRGSTSQELPLGTQAGYCAAGNRPVPVEPASAVEVLGILEKAFDGN
ncbi:MAG: Gfo/Idh/MocA family protein [Mycobacteriaceae bacterium]|uniref:Gfo/Idh/MocA family protein n=1 Tax=Corynebacterium sp. TaxID=1720 RepID=UPI003F9C3CF7